MDSVIGAEIEVVSSRPNNQCLVCEKIFSTKHVLKKHLKTHADKTHQCSVCEKSFYFKYKLKEHERTHLETERYTCEHCGKGFCRKSSVNKHKRDVHQPKMFSCTECYKKFGGTDGLNQHLLSHTRQPVKCLKCDQMVKSIKKHMSSCHSDTKATCKLCFSVFKSKRYLNAHMIYKHLNPDRYTCPRCSNCFSHRNLFINHKKACTWSSTNLSTVSFEHNPNPHLLSMTDQLQETNTTSIKENVDSNNNDLNIGSVLINAADSLESNTIYTEL